FKRRCDMSYSFENLDIIEVSSQKDSVFIKAGYPDWVSSFSFILESDGMVKGRITATGDWYPLSEYASKIIRTKLSLAFSRDRKELF
ncbi:MAG: hypothetical protein PHC58_04660, partial [Candidatus Omnitrophica bacterium]|nr:hypothetical protein [Candidatus Omnitrophota bacterium]